MDTVLAPVRDALLVAARGEAEQVLAGARESARDALRRARAQASAIVTRARDRGVADGAELAAAARSQTARAVRTMELAAERAEYEALREAARHAVAKLCEEPGYQRVRLRMAAALRGVLGDDAQVHDAPGGGAIAIATGRRADLSLTRLADQAVDTVFAADSRRPADPGHHVSPGQSRDSMQQREGERGARSGLAT